MQNKISYATRKGIEKGNEIIGNEFSRDKKYDEISRIVEEKINISDTKKDVAKNVIAQFTANAEELKNNDKWITYEEFSVCYKTCRCTFSFSTVYIKTL